MASATMAMARTNGCISGISNRRGENRIHHPSLGFGRFHRWHYPESLATIITHVLSWSTPGAMFREAPVCGGPDMNKSRIIRLLSIASLFAFVAATASAQSLGTFRWQLAPYCNLVTVNVVQTGAVYTLDGWDDQCGNLRAPVVGAATLNFDGSIELGMNIVTAPGGAPVHVAARITLPSASGQWSDSAGNSGAFILGGNPSGLAPRPSDGIGAPSTPRRCSGVYWVCVTREN
jgi:hypothetical protein